MTQDDRRTPRDRDPTLPDGLAARTREGAVAETPPVDGAPAPQDSARKPFNPWRFGFHTVSAEHRRELLEMEIPETPAERLFDQNALDRKGETSASPPALTVDADGRPDSSRKVDKLRLRRGLPLVHPIRLAGVWAGLAAVAVVIVLWLLFGGTQAPTEAPAKVAAPSISALSQAHAAAPASPTTAPLATVGASPEEAAPPQPSASASVTSKVREASSRPASQPATKPVERTTAEPKPPSAPQSASPGRPKGSPDDDASPFGHWTAPPRDN